MEKYLYRIKQIDFDNNLKYSEIREVELRNYDYGIYQNYPNPANKNTIIKYQLPDDGNVSLILYNSAGSRVKVLVNEKKQAGIYQLDVNTEVLPIGNYYYTFRVNNFTITKNLTVVK